MLIIFPSFDKIDDKLLTLDSIIELLTLMVHHFYDSPILSYYSPFLPGLVYPDLLLASLVEDLLDLVHQLNLLLLIDVTVTIQLVFLLPFHLPGIFTNYLFFLTPAELASQAIQQPVPQLVLIKLLILLLLTQNYF